MEFLINMLMYYSNNSEVVELIAECLADNDKSHNKLVEFLKSNNFENDKFEGYMYEINCYGDKRWKNKEGELHRTCIAEKDVTIVGTKMTTIIKKGQILPAEIYFDGSLSWYKEGKKMSIDDITEECSIDKVEIFTKEFSRPIKSVTIERFVIIVEF